MGGAICNPQDLCDGARTPTLMQVQNVKANSMARRIDELENELRLSVQDNRRLKIRCDEVEAQIARSGVTPYAVADDACQSRTVDERSTVCSTSNTIPADIERLRQENEQLKCKIRMLARA